MMLAPTSRLHRPLSMVSRGAVMPGHIGPRPRCLHVAEPFTLREGFGCVACVVGVLLVCCCCCFIARTRGLWLHSSSIRRHVAPWVSGSNGVRTVPRGEQRLERCGAALCWQNRADSRVLRCQPFCASRNPLPVLVPVYRNDTPPPIVTACVSPASVKHVMLSGTRRSSPITGAVRETCVVVLRCVLAYWLACLGAQL